MPTLKETDAYVADLFEGVTDKAGQPYITHCRRVMERLPPWVSGDARHAALLHDVIEDTNVAAGDLLARGYSMRTVQLVHALSRPPRVPYMKWIEILVSTKDAELIAIKLADNRDNADPERVSMLSLEEQPRIVERYERARRILESAHDPL